ncbi:hypothetical protein [Paraburkholderia caballeronis]|uniref:Uncharacterized protein n=1 Tax=Paraburkholderia caballeronis TaxID=416943 RepID=A0A1H7TZ89_9BURK|nr:hypothetical protein [Paraburkholderia caballeronis]PXW23395.1 hypothetical protein C7403_110133 [Paraburkholderia caballeronis]PXW98388.1 hypothetical protein C7407_110133 [Paraburkholderia caballeronis]RAJ95119.1 hypothetical protein C7409_110134 [Paraburkholderia caballeronis]SEC56049.1 hypothetical protein SAMN05445871_2427 [Paraburkholderia caballeronis]SEL89736.1 hypothetical protein SAMN05192542_11723 [Paraburkholderia caballeronis]
MEGMFNSAEQAIHVAYLVMSVDARQPNAFAQMLRHVLEELPSRTTKQEAMLEYLGGAHSSDYIDPAESLTMDEYRGQCAQITDRIRNVLPGPECYAVWSRWGVRTGPEGEKSVGVQGLAEYCAPLLRIGEIEAIQALVYGRTNERWRRQGLSYEEIAKAYSISVKTLRLAAATIRTTAESLENRAIQRLSPEWERDGLIAVGEKSYS